MLFIGNHCGLCSRSINFSDWQDTIAISFMKFLKITKPMTRLLQKDTKFEWRLACKEAFQSLKTFLSTAPVLAQLDIDKLLMSIVMLWEEGLIMCNKGV